MSEVFHRYSRWIDIGSLVVYVALLVTFVVWRNWFFGGLAVVWMLRDTLRLARPPKGDVTDATAAEPAFRTRVDPRSAR